MESVQRLPKHTSVGAFRDTVAARHITNIGVVAATLQAGPTGTDERTAPPRPTRKGTTSPLLRPHIVCRSGAGLEVNSR